MNALLIARRDLIDALRDVRLFLLACIILGGAIALLWWTADTFSAAPRIGMFSRSLFGFYSQLLSLVSFVVLLPVAALAILREREAGTLLQLQAAPFRSRQIILGKVLGVVSIFLVILLLTLPIVGVIFFFVGVSIREYALLVAGKLSWAFLLAALGLFASVRSENRSRALSTAFIGGILVFLFLFICSNAISMTMIGFMGTQVTIMPISPLLFSLAISAVYIFLSLLIAYAFIRNATDSLARMQQTAELDQQLYAYIDQDTRLQTERGVRKYNPVLARGIRLNRLPTAGIVVIGILVTVVVYALAAQSLQNSPNIAATGLRWMAGVFGLIAFAAIPAIASEAMRDYELGTMDMLRMTFLRPRGIILGQAASATFSLLPLIALGIVVLFPIFLTAMLRSNFPLTIFFAGLITGVLGYLVVITVAQAAALCARTTSVGMPLAYCVVGALLFLPLLFSSTAPRPLQQYSAALQPFGPLFHTQGLNPTLSFADNVRIFAERTTHGTYTYSSGTTTSLAHGSWSVVWIGNTIIALLLITLALLTSHALFQRYHWRDR